MYHPEPIGARPACLVTGAAGFIGSHLVERLLEQGFAVTGIDDLDPYYDAQLKKRNLAAALGRPNFRFIEADLATVELDQLITGTSFVFHLAGQPGVRGSWGATFAPYLRNNVSVTQRLLEACKDRPVSKFVYASSSSVYGNGRLPLREHEATRPVSPYGVTKLAAEHLVELYGKIHGLPVVSLRYFTVYGPRQRPDMAFRRFIDAALGGAPATLLGDGDQTRDFTFVDDIVTATVLAALEPVRQEVINVSGGARTSLREAIAAIERVCGRPVPLHRRPVARGDVSHTVAATDAAERLLGFRASVGLEEGLTRQWEWQRQLAPALSLAS